MSAGALLIGLGLASLGLGGIPPGELVSVQRVSKLPREPWSPAWSEVPSHTVTLWPQRSVALNDRTVNRGLGGAAPRPAAVRAATDGRSLAVLLEWSDATVNQPEPEDVGAFADGAALQLPVVMGGDARLPYVGMGDDGAHVVIAMVRARAMGADPKELVAAGPGSYSRVDERTFELTMAHDPKEGRWRALFHRPLVPASRPQGGPPSTRLDRAVVPVAFAVWDGAGSERGGNKSLSGWKLLSLPGQPEDVAWRRSLEAEWEVGGSADPRKGKELTDAYCLPCHRIHGEGRAALHMAPDLGAVGPISTPGYLRRSIALPSESIVPHTNPNRHYLSSEPRPAGGFTNDETLTWYSRDESGQPTSRMPVFELEESEIASLVSYILSIPAPGAGAASKPGKVKP